LSPDPRKSVRAKEPAVEPAQNRQRLVEVRCGFAEMARAEAEAASARAVEAKRLYEEQAAVAVHAQSEIDPGAIQAAKDEAHRSFRAAVDAAKTRMNMEAAATVWLEAINRINGQGRVGRLHIRHERELADALLAQATRLDDMAEASAAMAESAAKACRAAQEALAAGVDETADETAGATDAARVAGAEAAPPEAPEPAAVAAVAAAAASATASAVPSPAPPASPPADESGPPSDGLVIDLRSPEPQVIVRLMRRDGRILRLLADRLAGPDAAARSRWGLLLSTFVDAIAAKAIDDACLAFPAENPFWGQFTPTEAREVARGLAALGFRYDGFSAFADGRVPTHRELAMAVGGAGLLPARVRVWPKPEEAAELFRGVSASGDVFIATRAPALTLGELVRLLGHRAELLADLWNEWPRVRPLFFETSL
jgi:hypothetical protein